MRGSIDYFDGHGGPWKCHFSMGVEGPILSNEELAGDTCRAGDPHVLFELFPDTAAGAYVNPGALERGDWIPSADPRTLPA
jgi:hypothetical protein